MFSATSPLAGTGTAWFSGRRGNCWIARDASPNDSHRISPGGKYPFGRDYADTPAVEDAAREVRALSQRGFRVGAVFMGPNLNAPTAETIYGTGLARIRSMDQLASAAGRLIRAEIQELE